MTLEEVLSLPPDQIDECDKDLSGLLTEDD